MPNREPIKTLIDSPEPFGEMAPKDTPLPVSKRTRVILEVVRTFAACSALTVNCLVALKVFGIL